MRLWQGTCIVHETFSERKLVGLRERYPNAKIIAHPECEEPVLKMADFIGSTTALLQYSIKDPAKQFIVMTEAGILHQMEKAFRRRRTFILGPAGGGLRLQRLSVHEAQHAGEGATRRSAT